MPDTPTADEYERLAITELEAASATISAEQRKIHLDHAAHYAHLSEIARDTRDTSN